MAETVSNVLAEGKTKVIYEIPGTDEVLVRSKDDITAGDGARHDLMAGKAELATQTTSNVFTLLQRAGIPTHFVGREGSDTFRAKRVDMIPVECVARGIAFGSYTKRNPDVRKGTRFQAPVLEFFDKDDGMHDPLLHVDTESGVVQRYVASQPISPESLIDEIPLGEAGRLSVDRWQELAALTTDVFEVLQAAWADQDVTLVDLKIECGFTSDGQLVVADVVDNDSWRIWPGGDPDQMVDKQLYREGQSVDYVADRYAWVAEATNAFAAA